MSAPIRFLGVAILAYVGLRTASSALALEPLPMAIAPPQPTASEVAMLPPGVPADMGPAIAPAGPLPYDPALVAGAMPQPAGMYLPYGYAYHAAPPMMAMPPQRYRYPAVWRAPPQPSWQPPIMPEAEPEQPETSAQAFAYDAGEALPLEQWPAIGTAGPLTAAGFQRTPSWGKGPLSTARPELWSVDLWALVRQPRSGLLRYDDPDQGLSPGLASGGSLGGSQAGMRVTWRPVRNAGVHLRLSSALMPQGGRRQVLAGGEGAIGVSYQPIASVPVRLLAERRQRFGPALGGGRNAFALLAEGGLYDREIGRGIRLDGYGQAGVVGARQRSLFADGALTATAPVLPRMALGGGVWGGVQPGLSRFDAGPRLSYQMSPLLRLHLDYRLRVAGRADPPSGPALTVSGGF